MLRFHHINSMFYEFHLLGRPHIVGRIQECYGRFMSFDSSFGLKTVPAIDIRAAIASEHHI